MPATGQKQKRGSGKEKTARTTRNKTISPAGAPKMTRKNMKQPGRTKPAAKAQKTTANSVSSDNDIDAPDYNYGYPQNGYYEGDNQDQGFRDEYENKSAFRETPAPAINRGHFVAPSTNGTLTNTAAEHSEITPPTDYALQAEDLRNEVKKRSDQNSHLKDQNMELSAELERHVTEHAATRQALKEYQTEVLDLKEAIKSLKRNAPDADEEPTGHKAKRRKTVIITEEFKHAEKAGKRFMANYCAFGDREDIFDGFAEAAKAAGDVPDNYSSAEDTSEDEGSASDGEGRHARRAGSHCENESGEEDADYDFASLGDRERFAKDAAMRFYNEAEAKEVGGWEKDNYQTKFLLGMSRMRSAFKDHHDDARVVFGLAIDADQFAKKDRKTIPVVAELLTNTTFLVPAGAGVKRTERAFRHHCLIQICKSVLFGRKALVTGQKSAMARSLFSRQWKTKQMNIHMIAFASYIAHFILLGEENLAHADKTWNIYWINLGILWNEEKKEGSTFVPALLGFYDLELNLNPTLDTVEADSEQAALLAELAG